ncbi:MAG: cytochrome P460 family protein [Rhodospirillales bacterium]
MAEPGLSDTLLPGPSGAKNPRGAGISGDPKKPRRHFRIRNPKKLTPEEAQAIYDELRKTMGGGYALSKHPAAKAYQRWRRYNTTPYLSASHGQRYVNNYANAKGAAYGMFEKAGRLPVGAVIAKDSFTVIEGDAVSAGPLFIMEKMPQGFNYVSGDWRYTMIMPDGSIFGETKGENAAAVQFCIPCHLAAEQYDHLHFMPRDVRATPN